MVNLLLSYCWTAQLIRAVVHATVAGTVGSWYFLSPRVPPTRRRARSWRIEPLARLALPRRARRRRAADAPHRRARPLVARRRPLRSRDASASSASSTCSCASSTSMRTPRSRSTARTSRARRAIVDLLVHHSGVDALVQKDFVGSAMALGSLVGGMFTCLLVGAWARATLGVDGAAWWQARATAGSIAPSAPAASPAKGPPVLVAGFLVGYSALSVVGTVVEAGATALFVCQTAGPSPALPTLDSTCTNLHRVPGRCRRRRRRGAAPTWRRWQIAIGRVTRE